jgi:initiation factor 1A
MDHRKGNNKGGKGYKKYKKSDADNESNKKLVSKEDFPESIYAKVLNMTGAGRLSAIGEDRARYICVIRGRLYKSTWIAKDDYIIILKRDYEKKNTADVLHKLSQDEIYENGLNGLFLFTKEENSNEVSIVDHEKGMEHIVFVDDNNTDHKKTKNDTGDVFDLDDI